MALGLSAQSVEFSFKSGIYQTSVKQSIERNISSLLTAINRASNSNGSLDLSSVNMTSNAKSSLNNLWKVSTSSATSPRIPRTVLRRSMAMRCVVSR